MSDAVRVHYESIPPGMELAVYSDGDIVVEVRNQGGFIFEPAQIRELQRALRQLPDTDSMDRSLGKNRLDEERRIRYNDSGVYISNRCDSKSVLLSEKQAIELEKTLSNLGY
jgi:hypothetical protein